MNDSARMNLRFSSSNRVALQTKSNANPYHARKRTHAFNDCNISALSRDGAGRIFSQDISQEIVQRFRTDTEKTYITLPHINIKLFSMCDYVVIRGVSWNNFLRVIRVIGVGYSVKLLCWFYLYTSLFKVYFLCIWVNMFYSSSTYHTGYILYFLFLFSSLVLYV